MTDSFDRDLDDNLSGTFSDASLREQAQIFKILSDESRLRILALLATGDQDAVAIGGQRPGLVPHAVSHHLALLRVMGLIECRRRGRQDVYSLNRERVRESYGLLEALSRPSRLPEG
jgi:DNA-binding transcriptional ArsR family regulator